MVRLERPIGMEFALRLERMDGAIGNQWTVGNLWIFGLVRTIGLVCT